MGDFEERKKMQVKTIAYYCNTVEALLDFTKENVFNSVMKRCKLFNSINMKELCLFDVNTSLMSRNRNDQWGRCYVQQSNSVTVLIPYLQCFRPAFFQWPISPLLSCAYSSLYLPFRAATTGIPICNLWLQVVCAVSAQLFLDHTANHTT